jgi:hypothetical protein
MARILLRHRYKNKEIYQTRKLIFEPYDYNERNICLVMGLIERNLTSDLLSHKKLLYSKDIKTNSMYGHCYHASQALYYLMNTDLLQPMSANDYRQEKHWWLQNGERIYDVTEGQYYSVGKIPPHSQGKKSRWYGWKERPQQISLNLMIKVLGDRLISDEALTI